MATASGSFQESQSWLPSEFLAMGKQNFNKTEFSECAKLGFTFPTEFPYEFDSFCSSFTPLSSPEESVIGSTETESSDEDDFLAGLTRRLTQQLTVKPEKLIMAGSPQSTLSGIRSSSVSSNGSPTGVFSPPKTPYGVRNDEWDLIYAAAGEVARLKLRNEITNRNEFQENGFFGSFIAENQDSELKNRAQTGIYANRSFGHSLSPINQYECRVRQENVLKQQCPSIWSRQQQQVKVGYQGQGHHHRNHNHHRRTTVFGCGNGGGLGQSTWPQLHENHQNHQCGSSMRGVPVGRSNVAKKECAGTGVFLPRRYSNNNNTNSFEHKKKQAGCSTVLLPAKVVQALNLNLDQLNGRSQPLLNSGFAADFELLMARRKAILAQQKRTQRQEAEVRLPQEWTY